MYGHCNWPDLEWERRWRQMMMERAVAGQADPAAGLTTSQFRSKNFMKDLVFETNGRGLVKCMELDYRTFEGNYCWRILGGLRFIECSPCDLNIWYTKQKVSGRLVVSVDFSTGRYWKLHRSNLDRAAGLSIERGELLAGEVYRFYEIGGLMAETEGARIMSIWVDYAAGINSSKFPPLPWRRTEQPP